MPLPMTFGMEYTYDLLASRAHNIHAAERNNDPCKRIIIAFAGPPGSGKSTAAQKVVNRLNKHHDQPWAQVLPMDGFHYSQSTLDVMPNKAEAYARRGTDWTFDAPKLINFVQHLRCSKTDSKAELLAPSFDHAMKDPKTDAIKIGPNTSLVILEGSWLLLDQEPWNVIPALCDDTWFIDVEPPLARARIAKRHVQAGIEADMSRAILRADTNDMINGEKIRSRLVAPNLRVQSVETTDAALNATPASVAINLISPIPGSRNKPAAVGSVISGLRV